MEIHFLSINWFGKILIVEVFCFQLGLMSHYLKEGGYYVIPTTIAKEVLEIVKTYVLKSPYLL